MSCLQGPLPGGKGWERSGTEERDYGQNPNEETRNSESESNSCSNFEGGFPLCIIFAWPPAVRQEPGAQRDGGAFARELGTNSGFLFQR